MPTMVVTVVKWVFFVAKRYAMREAEKCWYLVRKATKGRYAVSKGGCQPLLKRICTAQKPFLDHTD